MLKVEQALGESLDLKLVYGVDYTTYICIVCMYYEVIHYMYKLMYDDILMCVYCSSPIKSSPNKHQSNESKGSNDLEAALYNVDTHH